MMIARAKSPFLSPYRAVDHYGVIRHIPQMPPPAEHGERILIGDERFHPAHEMVKIFFISAGSAPVKQLKKDGSVVV
jgi:hypothetical protein